MRTLVYKRTHTGDPDANGRFGLYDCMHRVRGYDFDAVIGIGGVGREAISYGIDRKLTWVGVGARKRTRNTLDPLVTFDRFVLFDEGGVLLESIAPILAQRFYALHGPRYMLNFNEDEQAEIDRILESAVRVHAANRTAKRKGVARCI